MLEPSATILTPAAKRTSASSCLLSSVMNDMQNRRISLSDLPFGSKSDPPFPPPIERPVKAFLKVCSNPKNFNTERLTEGCKRRPPL